MGPALEADLVRLASLVPGDRHRAESVVATVVERADAEEELHRWQGEVTRDIWMYTLTVRACRERLDGLAPSLVWAAARAAEHAWTDTAPGIDAQLLTERIRQPGVLAETLAQLPDPDRVAVVLHDVCGLSLDECAAVERAPVDITAQQLVRGRRNLLMRLAGHDGESAEPSGIEESTLRDALAGLHP